MRRAPVSVVIPCFEAADTVERALRSVAAQTLPAEETLVVDDGSSPEEAARLAALVSRAERTRLLTLAENRGPASARNAGWNEARQPYVAFLDSDDLWHPRKLELQVPLMEADRAAQMSGHRVRVLSGETLSWPIEAGPIRAPSPLRTVLWNPFATPSVMVQREIPFRFREGKRHVEDHALWMQMALSGCKMLFLDAELAGLFKPLLSGRGQSSQLWEMELGELDAYWDLHREGKTSALASGALCALSLVKFVRRVLVVRALQPAMRLVHRASRS